MSKIQIAKESKKAHLHHLHWIYFLKIFFSSILSSYLSLFVVVIVSVLTSTTHSFISISTICTNFPNPNFIFVFNFTVFIVYFYCYCWMCLQIVFTSRFNVNSFWFDRFVEMALENKKKDIKKKFYVYVLMWWLENCNK